MDYMWGMNGVAQNLTRAAELLQEAADAGHAAAQQSLGDCYAEGQGVIQDESRAFVLYQHAANQGNVHAHFSLGLAFLWGLGVQPDPPRAVELFEQAAAQGDLEGQYHLAFVLEHGEYAPQNVTRAVQLYEQSAVQGNVHAQFRLAKLFARGELVSEDVSRSMYWLTKAAAQDHGASLHVLSVRHAAGNGVIRNVHLGLSILVVAASVGVGLSRFELAKYRCLRARKPNRAYHLCKQASKQGIAGAISMLPSFRAACTPMECHAPECGTVEAVYKDFQICGGCRRAKYCSVACQRAHWRAGHKEDCKRASSTSALVQTAEQRIAASQSELAQLYLDVAGHPTSAYFLCKQASKQGLPRAIAILPSLRASCVPMECYAPECCTVEAVYNDFQICGGCRRPRYCSVACQRAHWHAGHKEECKRASIASAANQK